jgi:hypothetical protein
MPTPTPTPTPTPVVVVTPGPNSPASAVADVVTSGAGGAKQAIVIIGGSVLLILVLVVSLKVASVWLKRYFAEQDERASAELSASVRAMGNLESQTRAYHEAWAEGEFGEMALADASLLSEAEYILSGDGDGFSEEEAGDFLAFQESQENLDKGV